MGHGVGFRQGIFLRPGRADQHSGRQERGALLQFHEHGPLIMLCRRGASAAALDGGHGKLGLFPQAHEFAVGKELDIRKGRIFAHFGGRSREEGFHGVSCLAADMLKRKKPGLASRLLLVEADTLPFI